MSRVVEAAALMKTRAEVATDGGFGWRVTDIAGANEVWAPRDVAGWDAFLIASTATRLNPNPGTTGHADATHIASLHPGVASVIADALTAIEAAAGFGDWNSVHAALNRVAETYLEQPGG